MKTALFSYSKLVIILALTFIIKLSTNHCKGQITDIESNLRAFTPDSSEGWHKGSVISTNLSQTSLTNWAAGGQNSVAISGLFNFFINYKMKKSVWDNSFDLGYGILRQGKNSSFLKTDDKIDILSKYGRKSINSWYYAALLNFKSQMANGYNYPNDSIKISGILSPAYVLSAFGMDYKPSKYFSAFIAPGTSKITIVNNQELANNGSFGVDKAIYDIDGNLVQNGSKFRSEFGGYIRIIYSKNDFQSEFLNNITLTSKIDLFSNYLNNPKNIDISWESLIALKVNKFVTINLNTHLLYDNDIKIAIDDNDDGEIDREGPRTQFKEILAVGFTFKF